MVSTATSTGAVNSALESLTGIGGLVPMTNMAYGESVFGGVGSGLYTMLLYVLLAVFIGGLMVGRTPEFLGSKIEAREIKLVILALLVTPLAVLLTTGIAVATDYGQASIFASGPQGFSESLYAYLSQANNNGSAFAGYTGYFQPSPATSARTASPSPTCSAAGRCWSPASSRSSSRSPSPARWSRKRVSPAGLGTMRTDTPTFGGLVVFTVVLVGALTFLPALLLGPTVQGLTDRLF